MADVCVDEGEVIENERVNGEDEQDYIDSDEYELKMEKHIDIIDINKDGWTLLGASNLTSRLWTGGVWLFRQPSDTDQIEKCAAYCRIDSGVACGKFVDGLAIRAVFGQDSGHLELVGWEPPEDSPDCDENAGNSAKMPQQHQKQQQQRSMARHGSVAAHDDGVLCLDTVVTSQQEIAGGDSVSSTSLVVTGGADGCVRLWDLETMTPLRTYSGAHQHWVTGVSCHPGHHSRFATCSLDGFVLLWDTRDSKPATVLDCLAGDSAECLSWSPLDGVTVAVGSQAGTVSLYNTVSGRAIRSDDVIKPPVTSPCRPVHAMCWSADMLAYCSDNTVVTVLDVSADNMSIRYTNDSKHSDMIRGLRWFDPKSTATTVTAPSSTLYSCGWDGAVMTHTVT